MATLKTTKAKASLFTLAAVATIGAIGVPYVRADIYDDQMNALKSQNNNTQAGINGLAAQASDFQAAITALNNQIYGVQAAISANQARQADLQNQITVAQAKIVSDRKVLGDDIKSMYVDGQISNVEMLATSRSLSEYVDKQQYRTTVQTKLQKTLKDIQSLQIQLEKQQAEVQSLIADQRKQQSDLSSARAQQAAMLSYNQSQQDTFNSQIKANNAQIGKLRQQQIAENARIFTGSRGVVQGGSCGGGYPDKWCNVAMDSLVDNWGMYNRECVSYTAWKVYQSGRYMPYWGGRGNANEWDDNARRAGIPVDTTPRAGDVAIKNIGYYGHSMYVESVNADGTINISQYNQNFDGRYSTANRVSTAGMVFIHF